MWRQPRRVVKDNRPPRGTVRLGTQVWPATAIGASEFRRTQAKREAWLAEVAGFGFGGASEKSRHGGPNLRHHRRPQTVDTAGRRAGQRS